MGADSNDKICSQISPANTSLVDKKVFNVICSADRVEASRSFEPGAKQITCLSRNVSAVFVLLLSVIISMLELVQVVLRELVRINS